MLRNTILATAALAALSVSSAHAQNASQAQDLTSCAGAVAAVGGIDVLAYPRGAVGEWAEFFGFLVQRMNVEPGVEGMTGRYAASAARAFWAERPRAERQAAADACRTRFGGER